MKLQDAVRGLREALGISQEELARKLGITVRTIARYENELPPKGEALGQLFLLAEEANQTELADVFIEKFAKENRREQEKIRRVLETSHRWQEIGLSLQKLLAECEKIRPADLRERIGKELNQLGKLLADQKISTSKRQE